MQRYQTENEHRKAMRAKINKTIKRGKRRKRIIRRLRKAVPGICIGVLIAGMGAWCIAAPLPDPDDYEPYRFQAENGQWYTQEEYEQMSRERDAYHQREREEAEKEAQMIRDYQEQYQKDQEAEWKLYQEQTRTGLIHSMDFDASDAYLLEKIAMAEAESEDTEGKALVMLVVLNRVWDTRFPDTIEEVIMQDGAFTPVSNGRYDKVEPDVRQLRRRNSADDGARVQRIEVPGLRENSLMHPGRRNSGPRKRKPTCRINGARSPSKDCPRLSADQRTQSSSEHSGSDAAHTWPEIQGYP